MKKAWFSPLVFTFVASVSYGAIFDGGTYSAKKVSESVDVKPLGPDLSPGESHFSSAPTAKTMYVIGEDKKCYWGSFAKSQEKTVLVMYYSSPVSSEHCVYQSEFSPKPSGYSLWVKDGGRCVSSHADVEGEKYDWVVKIDEAELGLNDCFRNGVSYGDVIDKKHHKFVAKVEDVSAVREVVKTAPVVVKAVSDDKRGPSSIDRTSVKAEMSKGQYTLQFSSHLTDEEAQEAIKGLKSKGLDAFEIKAEVAGKARFRVCVGHFTTTKIAREFHQKLPSEVDSKNAFVQVVQ
jgi:hypothetical protein